MRALFFREFEGGHGAHKGGPKVQPHGFGRSGFGLLRVVQLQGDCCQQSHGFEGVTLNRGHGSPKSAKATYGT